MFIRSGAKQARAEASIQAEPTRVAEGGTDRVLILPGSDAHIEQSLGTKVEDNLLKVEKGINREHVKSADDLIKAFREKIGQFGSKSRNLRDQLDNLSGELSLLAGDHGWNWVLKRKWNKLSAKLEDLRLKIVELDKQVEQPAPTKKETAAEKGERERMEWQQRQLESRLSKISLANIPAELRSRAEALQETDLQLDKVVLKRKVDEVNEVWKLLQKQQELMIKQYERTRQELWDYYRDVLSQDKKYQKQFKKMLKGGDDPDDTKIEMAYKDKLESFKPALKEVADLVKDFATFKDKISRLLEFKDSLTQSEFREANRRSGEVVDLAKRRARTVTPAQAVAEQSRELDNHPDNVDQPLELDLHDVTVPEIGQDEPTVVGVTASGVDLDQNKIHDEAIITKNVGEGEPEIDDKEDTVLDLDEPVDESGLPIDAGEAVAGAEDEAAVAQEDDLSDEEVGFEDAKETISDSADLLSRKPEDDMVDDESLAGEFTVSEAETTKVEQINEWVATELVRQFEIYGAELDRAIDDLAVKEQAWQTWQQQTPEEVSGWRKWLGMGKTQEAERRRLKDEMVSARQRYEMIFVAFRKIELRKNEGLTEEQAEKRVADLLANGQLLSEVWANLEDVEMPQATKKQTTTPEDKNILQKLRKNKKLKWATAGLMALGLGLLVERGIEYFSPSHAPDSGSDISPDKAPQRPAIGGGALELGGDGVQAGRLVDGQKVFISADKKSLIFENVFDSQGEHYTLISQEGKRFVLDSNGVVNLEAGGKLSPINLEIK